MNTTYAIFQQTFRAGKSEKEIRSDRRAEKSIIILRLHIMAKKVSFKVGMTCGGCKGAVTRILTKIEGVTEVQADVETKLVEVTCDDSVDNEGLLNALKNWGEKAGKTVELIVE